MRTKFGLGISLLLVSAVGAMGQKSSTTCPLHSQHVESREDGQQAHKGDHQASLEERGDKSMGFSQNGTRHHFLLTPKGGEISVESIEPTDQGTVEKVRLHLRHIATAFGKGDFSIPQAVHAEIPPGTSEMQRLKTRIQYAFEETSSGGLVRISTKEPSALNAVHDFLRFQIRDHKTGDTVSISK